MTSKYKVGDKVRIKSIDWYNENKDKFGEVHCKGCTFVNSMKQYCNSIITIEDKREDYYSVKENAFHWIDEMIEGLVEEKTLIERVDDNGLPFNEWLSHKGAFHVPEDYVLKDENGNVINAQKIVLEKKGKEYPKTYEECCKVLGIDTLGHSADGYKWEILSTFQNLLICRDAYWKIAGAEMGLGKPWEPTDSDYITGRYCIFVHMGNIICDTPAQDCILTFPTAEMRDAFYENFKELINSCKELL